LRQNGAACAAPDRRRGLMGRGAWRAVENRFLEQAIEGRLHATFEVIYGHAWKGLSGDRKQMKTDRWLNDSSPAEDRKNSLSPDICLLSPDP
ncbi:MAG: hypothetical protein LBM17_02035, partial [Candidatus Accumulibacter sp.]|nr:hypothetical protein [Accumulibacter sp.]